MKRNVLMVYLKDIRDLEVTRNRIFTSYQQAIANYNYEKSLIEQNINELQRTDYMVIPEKSNGEGLGCYTTVFIVFAIITLSLLGYGHSILGVISAIFDIIAGLAVLTSVDWGYEKRLDEANLHNEKEHARLTNTVPAQVKEYQNIIRYKYEELNQQQQVWRSDYDAAGELLEQLYGMNIIPQQYRNLASIWYIYEYMSTSQATLQETLMHEHMENGIQRLESKIDIVVAQNEELIYYARKNDSNMSVIGNSIKKMRDDTERMLDNEMRMLKSIERTEQTAIELKETTEVAAHYAEVNAFFNSAEYFKK